jgi:hypothetical protein
MSISDFHLISIQLGDEAAMLERALGALNLVEPGETAFLPEYLAWTPRGSGRAFARLIALAQERNINIITTLNLGADLIEDLPGHDEHGRYDAVVIFTRHGVAHVPQAKFSTHSFEMDQRLEAVGIGVASYPRINRVRVDIDEELLDVRFLLGSDLVAFQRFSPRALQCDLLVLLGGLAFGAEKAASRLLGRALEEGVANTVAHVNAFHMPRDPGEPSLAIKMEEVLDATQPVAAVEAWKSPRGIRSAFYVYDDEEVHDFESLAKLPKRAGKIPLPRSLWEAELLLGEYPVTIVL